MTLELNTKWIPRTDTFAARLALVRWRMGWNLKEAALACGFPEGNWREWETKSRLPRNIAEVALQISEHTNGVDDYWLMTGRVDDDAPKEPSSNGSTDDPRFTRAVLWPTELRGQVHPLRNYGDRGLESFIAWPEEAPKEKRHAA